MHLRYSYTFFAWQLKLYQSLHFLYGTKIWDFWYCLKNENSFKLFFALAHVLQSQSMLVQREIKQFSSSFCRCSQWLKHVWKRNKVVERLRLTDLFFPIALKKKWNAQFVQSSQKRWGWLSQKVFLGWQKVISRHWLYDIISFEQMLSYRSVKSRYSTLKLYLRTFRGIYLPKRRNTFICIAETQTETLNSQQWNRSDRAWRTSVLKLFVSWTISRYSQ